MAEEKVQEAVAEPQEESLDDILADFDQQMQPAQQQYQQPQEPDRIANIEQHLMMQQQQQVRAEIDGEMNKLKGLNDALANMDTRDLEGLVTARVQQDPRIGNAFTQRHSNPAAWDKVLQSMSQDIGKMFDRPDPGVSEDQKAMRAAVETQPDITEPDAPISKDLNNMNDAEFARYKESLM